MWHPAVQAGFYGDMVEGLIWDLAAQVWSHGK